VNLKILRINEVCQKTGVSRSTIYDLISRGLFPKSIVLASRRVGWIESEVDDWIQRKINERDYKLCSSGVTLSL
jgi:prophage regulatory protein